MKIRLTFPEKHYKVEDIKPLYEEFRVINGRLSQEWEKIELGNKTVGPDDLKDVQYAIYEFLKERTIWDSQMALATSFADFRRLMQASGRKPEGA